VAPCAVLTCVMLLIHTCASSAADMKTECVSAFRSFWANNETKVNCNNSANMRDATHSHLRLLGSRYEDRVRERVSFFFSHGR